MTAAPADAVRRLPAPVFTTGSLMRHVVVMTLTGSIGIVAIFAVDALSLFWVSRLGVEAFKAAIGYASQAFFLLMSVNIGLTISISANVSRALGAGDRRRARRLAASGLVVEACVAALVSALLILFRHDLVTGVMHARGQTAEIADNLLLITVPANVPMGVGMALSGVLRAAGDAKRAMYVTLAGGVITAFTDPLLIFGFGLGVYGAGWATVISRLVFLAVGLWGAVGVHNLVAWPSLRATLRDASSIMGIGMPAVLANLATPVAAIYTTRIWSDFGQSTVAGGAIVDRVIPLAFGVIFALTASIGPIIGQNYGARLFSRVRRTLDDALLVAIAYALMAWAVLAMVAQPLAAAFGAVGGSLDFVLLFCHFGAGAWVMVTCLFVANTAFNNLGFPVLSMLFNWGRATLGTIPFLTLGAAWGGVFGAMLGLIFGATIFGLGAVVVAYSVVGRLAKETEKR